MNLDNFIQKYVKQGYIDKRYHADIIKQLLEYQAKKNDNKINKRLLRKLLINYSATEKKLYDANQLKNKFLGMAAHDLRNPLISISGFSEMFLNDDLGPITQDQKEFLQIIYSTAKEMLILVNDLLDVSIIESGKLELNLQNGSIQTLLEQRIKIIEIQAHKKEMKLIKCFTKVSDFSFDSNRIAQVIDNLISNAIKYSPIGSNIYITLAKIKDMVQIQVKDEGPGISIGEQSSLFGEFKKMSSQPTGGEKSTGLGLSISQKIAHAHKGSIIVDSKPGFGSIFILNLPID